MNNFNLHIIVADLLTPFNNPPISHVALAPECGGRHRIRLFSTERKSRATNYCWPDGAIIRDAQARVILEIEQGGIVSPAKIGSKLLPIALSNYLIHEDFARPIPMGHDVTFIQVVNTALLRPSTRKLIQYGNLEADIRKLLPLGCVARYFLIPGVAADFQMGAEKNNTLLDLCGEGGTDFAGDWQPI
jgi:hypothetical protein